MPTNPACWDVEAYPEFLAERRKLIAAAINKFLDSLISGEKEPRAADEEIRSMIASGESETVEFKSSLRWDYKAGSKNKALEGVITKAVAGFMNGKGGTLLIGIGPKGEVLGLENDYSTLNKDSNRDGFEQKLTHLVANQLGKELVPLLSVSFVAVEDKDICWVRVEASPKPVYVDDGSDIKYYVRLGNTTQPLNAKEMTDYIAMRWGKGTVSVGQPSWQTGSRFSCLEPLREADLIK